MTTRTNVENKTLEMKGRAGVPVGEVVGKAIRAKGIADLVVSDLKNARLDLKEAGKDLKKAGRRVKTASRKSWANGLQSEGAAPPVESRRGDEDRWAKCRVGDRPPQDPSVYAEVSRGEPPSRRPVNARPGSAVNPPAPVVTLDPFRAS